MQRIKSWLIVRVVVRRIVVLLALLAALAGGAATNVLAPDVAHCVRLVGRMVQSVW